MVDKTTMTLEQIKVVAATILEVFKFFTAMYLQRKKKKGQVHLWKSLIV